VTALTRGEAAARAGLIEVSGYAIDLDLTGGGEAFGSATVIRFSCRQPGAGTFVEIRPAMLRRAMLNGRDLDPAALDGGRLALTDLRADNELRVEADMAYSRASEGLHRFTDPADGEVYLAAHCGVDNAQRVFAAFDQPDLKAPIAVTVAAPPGWTVLANAAGHPEPGRPGRWRFAATPPISTYLFTVVAGRYHAVRAEHRGIPFGLYCRRSLAGYLDRDAAEILAITRACFDRYQQLFDEPYPFDSYDQAFVPELEAGAMENPGCVTFRDDFVFQSAVTRAERQTRGMVIAHEMAHMWFGDLVTMRWWDDVWLSESFAEYMGFQVLSEATGFTGTWTDFALARKPRGYDADQRPTTHPVAPGPAQVPDIHAALSNYDDISYAKGASALRQLVAWLGRPAFLAGINDYLARHRFGNATLSDLLESLSRASGLDVGGWAARWLRTVGMDTLTTVAVRPAAGEAVIEHLGTRPHRLTVGVYDYAPGQAGQRDAPGQPGGLELRASVPVSVDAGARRAVAALPPGPAPALVLLNDGDLSYCKIRLDPRSWATVTAALSGIPDPLARAVVWNAARDLVRDGELAACDYLDLAARHLPAETDTSIVAQVLGFARSPVTDCYLDSPCRAAALALIAGACREIRTRAAQDPAAQDQAAGLRLAAVRGLIDSASGSADLAALRAWLDGEPPADFPDLAPDLRWRILLRLVVVGAASRAGIEQEYERDPGTTGRQWAARCRAALPEPAAKQAAWAAMFETGQSAAGELSGYLLTATAQGFWHPEQAELLAGYVPRYLPAVLQAAGRRGGAAARLLAQHGFPYYAVDEAAFRVGEECLERGAPAPDLRRLLADQLDDLGRALRVRSAQPASRQWI
jgi:aminopeptidase N